MDKVRHHLLQLAKSLHRRKNIIMALSCLVVFVTTYALILPAFTLEKDKAAEQGGIDVPSVESVDTEQDADANGGENADDVQADADEESGDDASDSVDTEDIKQDSTGKTENGTLQDETATETADPLIFNGDGYSIAVDDVSKILPEDTAVVVEELVADPEGDTKQEIEEKKEEYKNFYDLTLETVNGEGCAKASPDKEISFVKFYDICLQSGSTEIKPEQPVNIKIAYDEQLRKDLQVEKKKDVKVIHFAEDEETGEITAEVLEDKAVDVTLEQKKMAETTFEADSFSVYAVVYTVEADPQIHGQSNEGILTAEGEDYTITVKYDPAAEIPEGATLVAEEILPGTQAYDGLIVGASDALKEKVGTARFFDIEIIADDRKIEPKQTVDVTIDFAEGLVIPDGSSLSIVHFGDNNTEVITDIELSETNDSLTYQQDSFSTTGAVISGDTFQDGKYFIIHRSGNNYYALLNDGTTVQVSYDSSRKVVTFNDDNVAARALWDMSNAGTYYAWDYGPLPLRLCTIRGQNGNYLKIDGSDVVGDNTVVNLTAVPMNDNTGGFELHNIGTYQMGIFTFVGSDTALKFSGNSYTTGNDNATRILLAKYEVGSSTGNPPAVGDYTGKEVDRILLDEWLMSLFADEPMQDEQFKKTAEVYDYENRIYQIDLTAETHARVIMHDMDVAFSIDMSNSMLFPSELTPVGTVEMKQDSLYRDLDEDKVYFVISDVDGTATVNALFYEYDDNSSTYKWKYEDASKYAKGQRGGSKQDYVVPNSRTKINDAKDTGYYTLYTAEQGYVDYIKTPGNTSGDNVFRNPYNRLTDLNNAITTAFNFLDVMSEKYGIKIRVGWNGFAKDVQSSQSGESFDYRAQLHPLQDLEQVDYHQILQSFTTGQTGGGTRPDLAFKDASDNMGWSTNPNTERILILVTDGAPQGGSAPSGGYHTVDGFTSQLGEAIYQGQQLSNNKDVNIITLGLSTEHVKEANDLFEHIAYTPQGGEQMKYHATDGIALRYALIDAIRSITENAVLAGNITDTIDTAFYPVSSDGTPLNSNDWITLDGVKMTQKDPRVPHGVIGKDIQGDWTVTWTNQDIIHPDENHPDGWHGKVFVKAKEDFLGGNTIPTNEGDATLDLTGIREPGKTEPAPFSKYFNTASWMNAGWTNVEQKTETTPYVDVDELFIPPQQTEWTVYLGTEVDPLTQIKELYKNINVLEVVRQDTADPDHRMIRPSDMVYDLKNGNTAVDIEAAKQDNRDENGTPRNTIPLSDYLKKWTAQKTDLTSDEWATLIGGGTVTRVYSEYDHAPGEIKFTLAQTDGSFDIHDTTTPGDAVETYVLTATYEPYEPNNVDYKTGSFRTNDEGNDTSIISSEHGHIINVIKRILTIRKTDANGNLINNADAGEATFEIYQNDRAGNKVNVSTVTTSGGTYTWDYVVPDEDQKVPGAYWADTTTYYIKEARAPKGYAKFNGEIEVHLDIDDIKTVLPSTNNNNGAPYTWEQGATLSASGDGTYVTVSGNRDITISVKNDKSIDISIIKTNTDNEEIGGATFCLARNSELITDLEVYKKGSSGDIISVNDQGEFVIPVGGVTINGLSAGTYTLTEVSPPDGYNKLMKPIVFTIATNGNVTYDNPGDNPAPTVQAALSNTQYTVQNEPGAELPSAGGIGTTLFYVLGSLLAVGCGVVLTARRRIRSH